MARKSRSAKSSSPDPTSEAQSIPAFKQDPELSPIGRDANGRFARGNAGGPGNPHARHCARMLAMIRNWVDDDKMLALMQVLYDKAITGDMAALKLLFSYKVGKPGPAPEPDAIERDEWNRFEETAVRYQEIHDLLNTLPSNVANEIVRGTWPVAAGAWADNLGRQLLQAGEGDPEAGEASSRGRAARDEQNTGTPAPGELPGQDEQLEKYEEFMDRQIFGAPLPNGDFLDRQTEESGIPSTDAIRNSPRVTKSSPLPNGRAPKVSAAKKPATKSKNAPLPNRKMEACPPVEALSSPSPSSRHTQPATSSPPLSNGNSGRTTKSSKSARVGGHRRNQEAAAPTANRKTVPDGLGKSRPGAGART